MINIDTLNRREAIPLRTPEPPVQPARSLRQTVHRLIVTAGNARHYEAIALSDHLPSSVERTVKRSRRYLKQYRHRLASMTPLRQLGLALNWLRRKRLVTLAIATLVFLIMLPVTRHIADQQRYVLTPTTGQLLGPSSQTLDNKLTYDASKQLYQFNKDGLAKAQTAAVPTDPLSKLMHSQVGGASEQQTTQLYSVDIPKKLDQGITVYDNNLDLSFKLVPTFKSADGRVQDGHLVYPIAGGQAVYTLKGNGLKEDIVLGSAPASGNFGLTYKLQLPAELAAKPLPGGGIGIYSADPSLYGNITYGDSASQLKVMEARKNSAKTNLVFALPSPVIKQGGGAAAGTGQANFTLRGTTVSLEASQLKDLHYPLSIDPSVVVTSSSDFATGNNEGNDIDFPANQINRGGLTGGTLSGGWTATTSFTTIREDPTSIAYNGYLYIIGGFSSATSAYLSDVQYAPISSNGTLGTWTATTSLPSTRADHSTVAYNGYLYVIGGYNGSPLSTVQYAPINANGTLGTWLATATFTTGRNVFASVAYNGYLYIAGGYKGSGGTSGDLADVQVAKIDPAGVTGIWGTTTAFTTARYGNSSVAYNG
jgi:hypothetical protein